MGKSQGGNSRHAKFEMAIGDFRGDVSRPFECPKFCKRYPDAQDPEPILEELMLQL